MNYTGTSGNNTITGTSGSDTFNMGQGGNDTVNGGGGSDVFNFGAAFNELDTINGGAGSDTLNVNGDYASQFFITDGTIASIETFHVAAGHSYNFVTDDKVVAANTDMKVDGSDLAATDTLTFDGSSETTGHFTLDGGLGNDVLSGGSGNDVFYDRNGGNDTAYGNGGNDTFNFGANLTGADKIDGGGGSNKVNITGDYTGSHALVMTTSTFSNLQTLKLGAGFNYQLTLADQMQGAGLTVDASALASANTLTVIASQLTSTPLAITGGAGNDRFNFGGAYDGGKIDGGAGNDQLALNGDYSDVRPIDPGMLLNVETVTMAAGHSYNIDFSDGNLASGQTLSFNAAALGASDFLALDLFTQSQGSFFVTGGAGDDLIAGSNRVETINSGAGDDQIQPGGGNDIVNAGDGNDLILYFDNSLTATASLNGGAGTDELVLDGDYSAGLVFHAATMINVEGIVVDGDFSYNLTLADATIGATTPFQIDADYTGASDGLTFNDVAETNATVTVEGGMGNDDITAGGGTSILYGADGDDIFRMRGNFNAADRINGGNGNDTVVLAGDYSAGLTLGASNMLSVEKMVLSAGDSYKLTATDATVAAGQTLTVDGHSLGAADTLFFQGSSETDGAFVLSGGAGNDTLIGGAGGDTLTGGGGADAQHGNGGADIFAYRAAADSTSTQYDTDYAFAAATCKFDVNVAVGGVDALIASGALSTASFDTDLAAAVDSAHLAAHHAVVFTPNSGTLSGQVFLVIDENGTAGYQAGADLVIDLVNATGLGSLGTANFI